MNIQAFTPQLRTTDLAASIRFYTEVLGFDVVFRFQDFYAGLSVGNQRLHLKQVDAPDPPSRMCGRANTSICIWK